MSLLNLGFSFLNMASSFAGIFSGAAQNKQDEEATEMNNDAHDNKNQQSLNTFNSMQDQMEAISVQEGQNAINGAKKKLAVNQMSRASKLQDAMGQIG